LFQRYSIHYEGKTEMSTQLQGKKILIITSNTGIERDELLKPLQALRGLGATVTHASSKGGTTQTFVGDTEKDQTVESDSQLAGLKAADFDALVIPGGTVNADTLRQDADAQRLVKEFASAGKTVAAICHGPWLLINAGVIEGKTLTSYPSVRLDLENAGAAVWVDQQVKECGANGWTLITSRTPDDLPAFNEAIAKAIAAA
jgi:protease I